MGMSAIFVREEVAQVASIGLDLSARSRQVKVYCKGPDKGVNADTGVLVVLHGLGGRHGDISYKRLRRDAANGSNLLVIGVDYLGTSSYIRDLEHCTQQVQRHSELLTEHVAFLQIAHPDGEKMHWTITLNPERHWVSANAEAAVECEKTFADDFWDYGALQAMDVLNALAWLRKRLDEAGVSADWRRLHLISQSAGAQVAAMLHKFAPGSFASQLDVSGIWLGGQKRETLAVLLSSPFGRVSEFHLRQVTFDLTPTGKMAVWLRAPVGFPQAETRSTGRYGPPKFEDELLFRDVYDQTQWMHATLPLPTRVVSLRGVEDFFTSLEEFRPLHQRLFGNGRSEIRLIDRAQVDGKIFVNVLHEICNGLHDVGMAFGPELWASEVLAKPGVLASGGVQKILSVNGVWEVSHGHAPTLEFVAHQQGKRP